MRAARGRGLFLVHLNPGPPELRSGGGPQKNGSWEPGTGTGHRQPPPHSVFHLLCLLITHVVGVWGVYVCLSPSPSVCLHTPPVSFPLPSLPPSLAPSPPLFLSPCYSVPPSVSTHHPSVPLTFSPSLLPSHSRLSSFPDLSFSPPALPLLSPHLLLSLPTQAHPVPAPCFPQPCQPDQTPAPHTH